MGIDSLLYRIMLVAHIGSVVVAIGGIIAHGAYHAAAFRAAAPQTAAVLLDAAGPARRSAEWALYGVIPTGIVLVAFSDDTFSYLDLWVMIGIVAWLGIISALHGAVRPAVTKLGERATELASGGSTSADSDGDRLESDSTAQGIAGRLVIGEVTIQVLGVVALVAMIWKPGG
ncbi:MAG: hypothetical protein AAF467_11500 [Actinomycetota bacterium]